MTQPRADVEHRGDGTTDTNPTRRRRWLDFIAVVLLIGIIASSWCYAQRVWDRASWQTPLTYKGPYAVRDRSDILIYSGFIRAARDGHFAPFAAKFIPELGAPFDGNWNDWPYLEYVPLYLIGILARGVGIFAALNIALISCNLLAGLAFYFVARCRKIDVAWSFTAALAFGLAPFIFMHSPDHPMVAFCWYVPLMVLVLTWIIDDAGIEFGSKRFWAAITIAFMVGLFNPYFFVTFCQLVLLTAGATFVRTRNKRQLGTALCLVAATITAFIVINLDPWWWQISLTRNHGAVVRQFQWLEIYALKALDLVTRLRTISGLHFASLLNGAPESLCSTTRARTLELSAVPHW